MSGWFWIAIAIASLLAVGGWVDWRRRYSSGGHGPTPGEARRDAHARGTMHGPQG